MPTIHYCRLVLWAAWHHSRSWAQGIIFFTLVIAGVATLLVPNFGMTIDTIDLVNILKTPEIYAILFGSIVLVRLICAPYWVWSEERASRTKAESQLAELSARRVPSPNTMQNALSVEFLHDELHDVVQTLGNGTIHRSLKVSVLNRGNGWLSNCCLTVEQTRPSIHNGAVGLVGGFTLQADERRYSCFLYFGERFPDGSASPLVLLAHPGVMAYYDDQIGFPPDQPTIFTLKATSNDARESTALFRAFVENGRLQMEKI